jgi:hypothetical protein
MKLARNRMAAVAAVCLLSAGAGPAALAQSQGGSLDEERVRRFFQEAEETLGGAVREQRLGEAARAVTRHLAEDAEFWIDSALHLEGERVATSIVTLTGRQLTGVMGLTSAGLQRAGEIVDYELDISVESVQPIAEGGMAMVEVTYEEAGVLSAAAEGGEARAGEAAPSAAPVRFEAQTTCTHLLRPTGSRGDILIGQTTCRNETRIE